MTDRCPSTSGNLRCIRTACHAGWHQSGVYAWLDTTLAPTTADPCGVTIRVQPQRWAAHACTRPTGHDGAHGDGVLLWCDPSTLPRAVAVPPERRR